MPPGFEGQPAIHCQPAPAIAALPQIELGTHHPLFRVCSSERPVLEWDRRAHSDYRFSPIRTEQDAVVPVFYTARSPDAALLETVLRHSWGTPNASVHRQQLEGRQLVQLRLRRPLRIVSLAGPAAQRFGYGHAVAASQADARQYEATRAWAHALYRDNPDSEALSWISAQHLQDLNVMLWGRPDNAALGALLEQVGKPLPLLSKAGLAALARLAEHTGHVLELD